MQLAGKVVLVTGASSGIGAALAREVAARGARPVLVARRRERLERLAEELKGADALPLPADVAEPASIRAAVEAAAARCGRLDVLVNNAAVGHWGSVERLAPEHLDALLRTNVAGPVHAVQAALPALKRSRGLVVNVSSSLSKRALPYLAAYAGTKSMLDALSDGLRLELRPHGVRVLVYCAPETTTDFAASALSTPGEFAERPAPRPGRTPQAVARELARAIERERREVVAQPALGRLAFFFPRLVDALFYRFMVKRLGPGARR